MAPVIEAGPKVALVSMPWCSAWMPSIQLSVLRQCLDGNATHHSYELFVDYAATVSPRVYRVLSEAGGMIEEWIFAKLYFEREGVTMPEGFLDEMPSIHMGDRAFDVRLVETLVPVTDDFLDRTVSALDWGQYDVIAFSLSIYQTAPSMALAQRLKALHPDLKIVFGGNSCAGPAARAMLAICPYVDVVVNCEAELVFATLVARLTNNEGLHDLKGLAYREPSGVVVETGSAGIHPPVRSATKPNFDEYFERFHRYQLDEPENIWIPFESSRGCWWGEKSQCTFCGLHEIMKYRARDADDVIEELDYLKDRYGVNRFFSTDLILPNEYYRTFFPKLIETGRDFKFFYELKGNVRRDQVKLLADAGVSNVQPGLESLSSQVLRLMKKGLKISQGVQFLRWAREYGITVAWNVIVGMPKEEPAWNREAARRTHLLHHLPPPQFIQFELCRFSPIFDETKEHGLTNIAPLYIYKWIFPIDDNTLADLVYRFEYDAEDFNGRPPWLGGEGGDYAPELETAIARWKQCFEAGAQLIARQDETGGLTITDTREPEHPRSFQIPPAAAVMYRELDVRREREAVLSIMESNHADALRAMGGRMYAEIWLDEWERCGLVFVDEGIMLALANFDNDDVFLESGDGSQVVRTAKAPRPESLVVETTKVRAVVSTRDTKILEREGKPNLFAKKPKDEGAETRGVEWEADACRRLGDLFSAAGSGVKAPAFIGVDSQYGYCFEALDDAVSWDKLLLQGAGFDPRLVQAIADNLAALHSIDIKSFPHHHAAFENNGPEPGARFRDYNEISIEAYTDSPGFDYDDFLRLAQPVASIVTALETSWTRDVVIHGDCKPDNILVSADGAQVEAFVDWELSGLGDAAYDAGHVLGGLVATWLSSATSRSATSLVDLFQSTPIRSGKLAQSADVFLSRYCRLLDTAREAAFRERCWRYAGLYMLELGYVANATIGRMPLKARLVSELGARILETPDILSRAFAPQTLEMTG